MKHHDCQDLISLFNGLFEQSENTILIGGNEEPLYLPADADHPRCRVLFTRDYFASALHEIAHWCIAGVERRKLVDFGYWYFPEGRSAEQQQIFEQAEVKPQALECIFSRAAGYRFIPSKDDFSVQITDTHALSFEDKIAAQVDVYLTKGLPPRAAQFAKRLMEFYQTKPILKVDGHEPTITTAA